MSLSHRKRLLLRLLACVTTVASGATLASAAVFPSAEAASDALVAALKAPDQAELARILGADWRTYIPTDGVQRSDVETFIADYAASHRIVADGARSHISVGEKGWTLPIPLVRDAKGWWFDTRAGHDEIVARQVGHNELSVVQALLAYYDAQRDYAAMHPDDAPAPHYAARLISTPGKRDGLYWPSEPGKADSPLGAAFARPPEGDTYYGYHYRILTAQGPSAPGGAYDYMEKGQLVNGFALLAWPARYGETGVMSFEISHDGQVFQKDLGKGTPTAVTSIKRFDTDSSWSEVSGSP